MSCDRELFTLTLLLSSDLEQVRECHVNFLHKRYFRTVV